MKTDRLFSFEVSLDDHYMGTYQAKSRSSARYKAFIEFEFVDSYKIALKWKWCIKSLGEVKKEHFYPTNEINKKFFERTLDSRGLRGFCQLGTKIKQGDKIGFVVGSNASANLDVWFPEINSVRNCHPHWKMKYFDENNRVVKEFNDGSEANT